MRTPWGESDGEYQIAHGITFYETPSHGGLKLDRKRQEKMPTYMRRIAGWYEEDCEYVLPVVIFQAEFKAWGDKQEWLKSNGQKHVDDCIESFKHSFPGAYEKLFGVTLKPGESRARDRETWFKAHENDLITVAAWGDWAEWVPKGMVGVVAKVGGHESKDPGQKGDRWFLVPEKEYDQRDTNGFIINPAKHREIENPQPGKPATKEVRLI